MSTLLFGLELQGVKARLWTEGAADKPDSSDNAWDERFSGPEGSIGFQAVPPKLCRVYFTKVGYKDMVWPEDGPSLPVDGAIELRMELGESTDPIPVPSDLTPLRVEGNYLHNDRGRIQLNGATSFLAYKKFLDGEDLGPHLSELRDLGFNMIRVFGMVSSFSHWYPQEYGDRYYDQLPAFLDLCASYGLYVFFTVFADTRIVMPDRGMQEGHWNRVVEKLKERHTSIVDKVNEQDQHDNAVDGNIQRPSGILSCNGSNGSNQPCPLPSWDVSDFHVRRDYVKAVCDAVVIELREGYSGYDGTHGPVGHGEAMAFGEEAGPHGRWTDPERAREFSQSCGTAAFKVFHSDAGVLSNMLGPNQRECAKAWCSK